MIFFFGKDAENLNELIELLAPNLGNIKIIAGLAIAMPIGVLIHQLSVLIKNWCVSKIWDEFNDFPKRERILKLTDNDKLAEYCLERISNLNSFYYVRVDNGCLSPLIAGLVVKFFMGQNIGCTWILTAIVIGILTMLYLKRISAEMKEYQSIIQMNGTKSKNC